jgi:hypothetical protein
MKITKRQLRRIIREEKARLISEQAAHGGSMMVNPAESQELYSLVDDALQLLRSARYHDVVNSLPPQIGKDVETAMDRLFDVIGTLDAIVEV